jgi:hypothetical protein
VRTDRPGLWTSARLRLRGLDTAELYTQAGERARRFVTEALDGAAVVITTRRTDLYGRYLGDVKYLRHATDPQHVLRDGTFLNRQLLDRGLAQRYEGYTCLASAARRRKWLVGVAWQGRLSLPGARQEGNEASRLISFTHSLTRPPGFGSKCHRLED